MLSEERAKEIFKLCGAMWEGHFLLTSGLHGSSYIQCAKVIQHPKYNEMLSSELASRFEPGNIDVVLGAAVGGIIVSYELARQLDARAVFAERAEGEMRIRRGLEVKQGEKVLIVEDVVTTGGTVEELVSIVNQNDACIEGVAAYVNRNVERVKFDYQSEYLISGVMPDFSPAECPMCKQGIPLVKPGSRK